MVLAVVRNPAGSTHLKALTARLKNVHIIAGDVVDYSSLEVSLRARRLSCSLVDKVASKECCQAGFRDHGWKARLFDS